MLRYIEANPLRAGMVTDPADYRWSSFPHHGLGRVDPLVSGFPEWEELGATEAERRRRWRAKVRGVQDEAELAAVRTSLRSGRPLGTDDWTDRMAERLNIDLGPRPRGRPPKETACRLLPPLLIVPAWVVIRCGAAFTGTAADDRVPAFDQCGGDQPRPCLRPRV